jgi:acyl carrier protein
MTDAENRLLAAIKTITGNDRPVDMDSELKDLIRDSFDVFELQLALEEAFGIEMDNERFLDAKTVRDLLGLVSG